MFERFTDRARRVLVLAQEEARLLHHPFIGTEHLLLGLVVEGEGVAAQAIAALGISLDDVRSRVDDLVGLSETVPSGSPSFTPRAKKVLELSLREALQLGHNYIGTEHILLGVVREGEGVAAQVLVSMGVELPRLRQQVAELLSGPLRGGEPVGVGQRRMSDLVECSFCGRQPPVSGQLVAGRGGAYVCEHCVSDFSAKLADQTGDGSTAGQRSVVVTGRTPADEDAARMEIALAFGRTLVLSPDRRTVPSVQGGELLGPCLKEAQERHAGLRRHNGTVAIEGIEFIDEEHASVAFSLSLEGLSSETRRGDALVVEGTWKVARATFCDLMRLAGVECPPIP